ncbi:MAG: LOG family protein, partial [Planctomycetota bacterium]
FSLCASDAAQSCAPEGAKDLNGALRALNRTLRELRTAFKVFRRYRWCRKVAIFGSARTQPHEPTYRLAAEFGRLIADAGWMVVTGAAGGIMEAGHAGAGREASMGLNIMLPFEQADNPVIAGDPKLVHMKYFFTRKLMFVKESHAVCLLPGGFGTLDEGIEVLTLLQTGKRDPIPVVLLDEPNGTYWRDFEKLLVDQLLARGMIDEDDLALYRLCTSAEAAADEILHFYRNFHSVRYVRHHLVMRLREPPTPETLEEINETFRDLLRSGRFRVGPPLAEEADEPELRELPRLIFHFNRRNFGRLRRLIDLLNDRCTLDLPDGSSAPSPVVRENEA